MQIHSLKRRTKDKKKVQVGRGGKRGKTAGRGTKGQKARAGHKIRPELRDMIKRLPKLRGRGVNSNKTIQTKPDVLNLNHLSVFKAGEMVTPKTLVDKCVTTTLHGKYPRVKILATGDISIALIFRDCEISAGAREKIEKAGGTFK